MTAKTSKTVSKNTPEKPPKTSIPPPVGSPNSPKKRGRPPSYLRQVDVSEVDVSDAGIMPPKSILGILDNPTSITSTTNLRDTLMKKVGKHRAGSTVKKNDLERRMKGSKLEDVIRDRESLPEDELTRLASLKSKFIGNETGSALIEKQDILAARVALVYRYHIRRIPPETIMSTLGMSAYQWKQTYTLMMKWVKTEFMEVDIVGVVGDSIAFYDDIRSLSMQMTAMKTVDEKTKLAAMALALRTQESKHQFLANIGILNETSLRPIVDKIIERSLKDSGLMLDNNSTVRELIHDMAVAIQDGGIISINNAKNKSNPALIKDITSHTPIKYDSSNSDTPEAIARRKAFTAGGVSATGSPNYGTVDDISTIPELEIDPNNDYS